MVQQGGVPMSFSPEFVQRFLEESAGIRIALDEAARLVPLIAANREALRRLERFDLTDVRPLVPFDPTFPEP
jgi:hypothetical protein